MATDNQEGVIAVLLQQFESRRLPRLLSLKEKVNRGEVLNEFDIQFLEQVMENASQVKPLVDTHPDYQSLYTKAVALYSEIVSKAAENENKKH